MVCHASWGHVQLVTSVFCAAALRQCRYVDLGFSRSVETIAIVQQPATGGYMQPGPVQVYVSDTNTSSPGTYCAYDVLLPGGVTRHVFSCNGAVGRYAVATTTDPGLPGLELKDMKIYLYDAPGAEVSRGLADEAHAAPEYACIGDAEAAPPLRSSVVGECVLQSAHVRGGGGMHMAHTGQHHSCDELLLLAASLARGYMLPNAGKPQIAAVATLLPRADAHTRTRPLARPLHSISVNRVCPGLRHCCLYVAAAHAGADQP
jgi:hypothetical protein